MYTLSRECHAQSRMRGAVTRMRVHARSTRPRGWHHAPVPAARAEGRECDEQRGGEAKGIRAVDWQHAHGDSEGRNGRAGRRCSVRARQATWRSRPRTSRAPLARLGIRRAQERKAREGGKGGGGPRRASVRCACLGVSEPIRFPTLEINRKKIFVSCTKKTQ